MDKKQNIESRDYAIIGKLHAKTNPSDALTLLEGYKQATEQALDTNLHNLNYHFLNFCKLFSLTPSEYLGQLYVREKVERRRLFVGAMIKVYKPQMITYDISTQNGLAESLCIVLQYENGNMSKLMHEVIFLMDNKMYEFTDEVNKVVEKLMNYKNGYGFGPSLFEQMEVSA